MRRKNEKPLHRRHGETDGGLHDCVWALRLRRGEKTETGERKEEKREKRERGKKYEGEKSEKCESTKERIMREESEIYKKK